ncbi:MAG: hypothetical protein QNJ13_11450 [Paracoccaceae bacterium]|nr:hypothetical protein [Paracoccaceae bacterium]
MGQVIITVNGPGEISAWLTPLSRAIKAASPETGVLACLMPCVFSSGAERSVVERLDSVDAVAGIAESFGLIFRKRYPPGFAADENNLVLHLGGELVLSLLLARRLGAPAFAYIEHPAPILKRFERVFYNGLNKMPAKVGRRPTEPMGEMMVDSALAKTAGSGPSAREQKTIAIVPGSRAYMAEFLLPYFAEAADRIAASRPDISFVLPTSDYIDDAWYRNFPTPPDDRDWQASPVTYREDGAGAWFETAKGTRIAIRGNAEVLRRAGVAVTLPGTNTGELAASGIPMVTVLPTYRYCAEGVPLPGLAGHVAHIPIVGREIKVFAAGLALKKSRLLSIPSRRMGRRIAPELIGRDLHDAICREVIALVDDEARATATAVREAMGPAGAADRLAAAVLERLRTAESARARAVAPPTTGAQV